MNIIWTVYRRLRGLLPQSVIQRIRHVAESGIDRIWRKEYYGQFGEDAMLQTIFTERAWRKVVSQGGAVDSGTRTLDPGFYVDVGAFSPKQYSNTYWFYKRGWRGINIDAAPGAMKTFDKIRSRDINVEAAVSDVEQELVFYTWGTPTVCNTLSEEHAKEFETRLGVPPTMIHVHSQTLEHILDQHLPAGQQIDFLSVDAEANNLQVLRSNNWSKYTPSVIVVEVDVETVQDVMKSETTLFLTDMGYIMRGWFGASAVFEWNN